MQVLGQTRFGGNAHGGVQAVDILLLSLNRSLLETFKSTNPIESMISIARKVTGNVKRWRNGKYVRVSILSGPQRWQSGWLPPNLIDTAP